MNFKLIAQIASLLFLVVLISCGSKENANENTDQTTSMKEQNLTLFIGTYTRKEGHVDGKADGIYVYSFNPETRELVYRSTAKGIINPSYLTVHPSGQFVYAVSETGGEGPEVNGEVASYSFDKVTSELKEINRQSSEGDWPCYVSTDNSGQVVMVANYGGSIASYLVNEDGSLKSASSAIVHEGNGPTDRQEGPHAHMIRQSFDGSEVFAVDLGVDKAFTYKLNNQDGTLNPTGMDLSLKAGAGPRHIDFHPQLKVAYIINELNSTVEVFGTDEDGNYKPEQVVSTLAEGSELNGACADIHVHPNGRYLYASNRGDANSIAIYDISPENGSLSLIGHQSTMGLAPRSFIIDPSGRNLLVANQDSGNIVSFEINQSNGLLENPLESEVPTPVCLKFL